MRSATTNSAGGDRNVHSRSWTSRSRSRNSPPLLASFVSRRKLRGVDQHDSRRRIETARAAANEVALHARRANGFNQDTGVAAGKSHSADDGVRQNDLRRPGRQPLAQMRRHLLNVAFVEPQFPRDLGVGKIQTHKIDT